MWWQELPPATCFVSLGSQEETPDCTGIVRERQTAMNDLQKRLENLSPEKRELVLRKLREKNPASAPDKTTQPPPLLPAPRDRPIPLSFSQERLWFIDQLDEGSAAYNITVGLRLSGPLHEDALEKSLREIVRRHEILRTNFIRVNGSPAQVVTPSVNAFLRKVDLRSLPGNTREDEARRLIAQESKKDFNLASDALIQGCLIRLEDEAHVLFLVAHHIVFDGWSAGIVVQELTSLYEAFSKGTPSPLRELPIQYADYTVWQRRLLAGDVLETHLNYWKRRLAGAPGVLNLPTCRQRPAIQTFQGSFKPFEIGPALTAALNTLSRQSGATLFMTLLTAFAVLLYRYSGQEDVVIGSPIANRTRKEIEPLIGFFVNTLVFRTTLSGNPSFQELLDHARADALEAYSHQDVPFEYLVEKLRPERNLSYTPLFQIMFILQNVPMQDLHLTGLTVSPFGVENQLIPFDLVLSMYESGSGMKGVFVYNTSLFDAAGIGRMITHFQTLLESVVSNQRQPVSELPMLSAEERRQLLVTWNDTRVEFPVGGCVHHVFEAQATKSPGSVAATLGDRRLSYGELNGRANQLARFLREKRVLPDAVVGVMADRSFETLVGVLGILKAGGAYLPLDPEYPAERIMDILDDSGAVAVLAKEETLRRFAFTSLSNLAARMARPVVTSPRSAIQNLDELPCPDRTLVDYGKYHTRIGIAPARHTVSLQASRGCPFTCQYCHEIWPKKLVARSAENVLEEITRCYDAGVKRFVFVDDVFNLEKKASVALFEKIIQRRMDVQLFFPNGLRGDILTKDVIDLMAEAGTVNLDIALESASPRIQKLVKKNLNLEKFFENADYITKKYPHIILEMEIMFGFPTETEEEALLTLDFLKKLTWVHFPNVNILKIFPNTKMHRLAIEHGITEEAIRNSSNLGYHELPDTLPFSKGFVRQYQSRFMSEYFLVKERLLKVLPAQMSILTEDELVQKYDSYLPAKIKTFSDVLRVAGITGSEIGDARPLSDDRMAAPDFSEKMKNRFPAAKKADGALRVLLLDLSLLFSKDAEGRLYDMVEAPLGLMYLMTYLDKKFGEKVKGRVAKSRIDFDSFGELERLIATERPQVIGLRTLTLFKDFFHTCVSLIREWCPGVPVIAGGPYATSDYGTILADGNVDVAVLGEGEITFAELIGKILENGGRLPGDGVLREIAGIAFVPAAEKTLNTGREVILLDALSGKIGQRASTNLPPVNSETDLAYVIYTSGSTGRPKGVAMGHKPLTNLIAWHLRDNALSRAAKTLQFAPLSFDVSFQEMFSTWCSGGTLALVSSETRRDAFALLRLVQDAGIERMFLPFVALQQIAEAAQGSETVPTSLREIITAGEQLRITPAIARLFERSEGCALHNHYGPSESHVVTAFTLTGPASGWPALPPIGRPISNTKIYILDQRLQPTPVGVPGELYIGGVAVARGYLNRPELTEERFVPDPFCREAGARLYKTGDLARYLPDGNIEFLGRIDHQVKIRGFRIEPGEVEAILGKHPAVRGVAVLAREDRPGDRRLVAYFVSREGQTTAISELRGFLEKKLPDYMIPSTFVPLDALPLTSSGKVNRLALPAPDMPGSGEGEVAGIPRTPTEEIMAGLWAEVLGVKRVGIQQNFFDLGGHSLLATQLISRIREAFSVELPLRRLFETPTVAHVSGQVEAIRGKGTVQTPPIAPASRERELPLSFAQERLWFLDRLEGGKTTYNMPAALKLTGCLNLAALERGFREIAERHEILRTVFPVKDGRPAQVVLPAPAIPMQVRDLRKLGKAEKAAETRRIMREESQYPFDLAAGALMRATLLWVDEEEYVLLIILHHIIFDGWSIGIFVRELSALYRAFCAQEPSPLPQLAVQYADYACWQREWLSGQAMETQVGYWRNALANAPALKLPTALTPPANRSFCGNFEGFGIDSALCGRLHALGRKTGATLFMSLLAALAAMLFRMSGQDDVVIGSPVAGRGRKEIEPLIGFFVNILAIRINLAGDPEFQELLGRVRQVTLDAYAHQDVPFESVVRELKPDRKSGRQPVYQVGFGLQNMPEGRLELPGLVLSPLESYTGMTQADLYLSAYETKDGIQGAFQYDTEVFTASAVKRMAHCYKKLLEEIAHNPHRRLLDIPFDTEPISPPASAGAPRISDEAEEFHF